ncbi:MAG: Na+/H+ antiporter subunit E [Planctomycetes bacterium]|nr:Na+/H+ antiporter subunit E [Planctomycetota bacterium]
MLRHLMLFVVLLGFWAVLSGQLDWTDTHQRYLMICGVASCALATWVARRVGFLNDEGPVGRILVGALTYLPWLTWQVVTSNWDVAKRVWSRDPGLDPLVFTTKYEIKSDLGAAIFANSITLTPGTITIAIDTEKKEMLVHAIHPGGQEVKAMHDRVARMEGGK